LRQPPIVGRVGGSFLPVRAVRGVLNLGGNEVILARGVPKGRVPVRPAGLSMNARHTLSGLQGCVPASRRPSGAMHKICIKDSPSQRGFAGFAEGVFRPLFTGISSVLREK
jgi:hypothetical protein